MRRRLAALLVAIVGVAACGGDDDDTGGGASTTAAPTTTTETPATVAPATAASTALAWVGEHLGWDDAAVFVTGSLPGSFLVTSEAVGRDAEVTVETAGDDHVVTGAYTTLDLDPETSYASVSIGNREVPGVRDHVGFGYREDGLAPELTLTYGDRVFAERLTPGADAVWDFDLGFVPDVEGELLVRFVDAGGVALEAWMARVPAGPFSAG